MTEFASLGDAEKRYVLEGVLPGILRDLTHPAPTRVIADRLGRCLNIDPKEVSGPLVKLARGHPNATKTGPVKLRYGKPVTGYLWHPAAQETSSHGLEDIL